MKTPLHWAVALVAALLIVGLLIWARGDTHHRGDEVGSFGPPHITAAGE